MTDTASTAPLPDAPKKKQHPFRRAVLRGLGLLLPPLLTIAIFVWVFNQIEVNVLRPFRDGLRYGIVTVIRDVRDTMPPEAELQNGTALYQNRVYVRLATGEWIPQHVFDSVPRRLRSAEMNGEQFHQRYVDARYLRPWVVVLLFLFGFIVVLYLLGKFLAAGVGRMLYNLFEAIIHRLPVIRNVYSSVKQVTDFVFSEREIEFNRVVAVQYPRRGLWTVGFATGESMLSIRDAAGESVVTILIPTSPMPATGFTITAMKSEIIELDLTIDQAIQFIVSCGVVVPAHEQYTQQQIHAQVRRQIAGKLAGPNGAEEDDEERPPDVKQAAGAPPAPQAEAGDDR